jgi:hypothetical protein
LKKKVGQNSRNEKLLIFQVDIKYQWLCPKKRLARNSESAGISLEPDLKNAARQLAEQLGFGILSNYTRFLLTQELARARGEKSYKLNEETTPNGYSSLQKSVY